MGLIRKKNDIDFSKELVKTILDYANSLSDEEKKKFNGRGVLCEFARAVLEQLQGSTQFCYIAEFKNDMDNCEKLIRNRYNVDALSQHNLELYCDRALDIIHYLTEQVKEEIYHVKPNR